MAVGEVEDPGTCKVKFLCSHGGKILPRPADGKLKYIGGETRLVVVPRNINFAELMIKLGAIFGGDTVLKYQLIPEDLDALVSVTNDDDLRYMLDEYDRHSRASGNHEIPKVRAFLFPSDPTVIGRQISPNNTNDSYSIEQRYIDAINGVVHSPANVTHPSFSISSSCGSSPRSTRPDIFPSDITSHDIFVSSGLRRSMHRVHSSPSDLCNLSRQRQIQHQQQHQLPHPPHPNPQHHQHSIEPPKVCYYSSEQQPPHSHRHHCQQHPLDFKEQHPHSHPHRHRHQHSVEQQCHQPHMISRFPGHCNGGMSGQFQSNMLVGRSEISKPPMVGHSKTRYYSPSRGQNVGCIGCGHVKECRICRNGGF